MILKEYNKKQIKLLSSREKPLIQSRLLKAKKEERFRKVKVTTKKMRRLSELRGKQLKLYCRPNKRLFLFKEWYFFDFMILKLNSLNIFFCFFKQRKEKELEDNRQKSLPWRPNSSKADYVPIGKLNLNEQPSKNCLIIF